MLDLLALVTSESQTDAATVSVCLSLGTFSLSIHLFEGKVRTGKRSEEPFWLSPPLRTRTRDPRPWPATLNHQAMVQSSSKQAISSGILPLENVSLSFAHIVFSLDIDGN